MMQQDLQILRRLAAHKAELAASDRNKQILAMWNQQAKGVRDTPTVRLCFMNFRDEVVTPRMRCQGEVARNLEALLLSSMVGRDLFEDDTPISEDFAVELPVNISPFGAKPKLTRAKDGMGFHIEPLTEDIEEDFEIFQNGSFQVDTAGAAQLCEQAHEAFGDILPVRTSIRALRGAITNPLVQLISMQTFYMAMYDSPEALHGIMDMATRVIESCYDYLQSNKLLMPTNGMAILPQESFAFTDELPAEGPITSTKQVWGFMESQESTAISPAMYGEFVYPYQDRLAKRFGLLSYGCCERVDLIWEDYLSKWKNLRKLSVSPFNDEVKIGQYLRGSRVVYYSKPRAEYVTNPGPLDEDALRRYFRGVAEAASGCLLEMAQREVGTIFGDYQRGKRYVQIAKETIDTYWKP